MKTVMQRGPIAVRVAENVRALRKERGLDLEDVSNELSAVGWPISVSVLSKLELGQRRADVDDLVALAIVLDVSPNRLLLPGSARSDQSVALTLDRAATEREAWEWATGERALDLDYRSALSTELAPFPEENRPHHPPSGLTGADFFEKHATLKPAVDAVVTAAEQTGWTPQDTLSAIETALTFVDMGRAMGQTIEMVEAGRGEHQ